MTARRALAGAAALLTVLAAGSIGAAPAVAVPASASLEVSLDGSTWSSSLPEALFGELPLLVPGDVVTRTLYVRNASGADALLRLDAVDVRIDNPDFARALRLEATTGSSRASSGTSLNGTADCLSVLPSEQVSSGEVLAIAISLGFDENAGMPTLRSSAALSLQLSASEDVGQVDASTTCPVEGIQLPVLALPDDSGDTEPAATDAGLAVTGAFLGPFLAAAGTLVLIGLGVIASDRRRKRAE